MRNPSKNTIKRLVRATMIRQNELMKFNLFSDIGTNLLAQFVVNSRIYTISKGKISISNFKGCELQIQQF